MLIPASVFEVVACCDDASVRYALNCVHIERDEDDKPIAVATDGRQLIKVTWDDADRDKYPNTDSNAAKLVRGFAANVPDDLWNEAKGLLTKSRMAVRNNPILNHVAVDEELPNNKVNLTVTGLTTSRLLQSDIYDGLFPKWRDVLKSMSEMTSIRVDANKLAKLLVTVLKTTPDIDKSTDVELHIPFDGNSAVRVTRAAEGVDAYGLLMPIRAD